MSKHKISLSESLAAYRCIGVDKSMSWKQHLINEKFSSNSYIELSDAEKMSFDNRLDFHINIQDNIKLLSGRVTNGTELINYIISPENAYIQKMDRKVVFSSIEADRPNGNNAFMNWNGFQVIDMDIKDVEKSKKLKQQIFDRLIKYNWFLGVAMSTSGTGLHIYTKIQVAEGDDTLLKRRILYLTNFRHKYSFVYLACLPLLGEINSTEDDLLKWMDLSMFRPQQGAFITTDTNALISTQFFEDFIYVCFDEIEDMGHPDIDWVSHPSLKMIFRRWEWFENESEKVDINISESPDLDIDTHNKFHYKHFERWRLANTLVKLYGVDKGYTYMRHICDTSVSTKEIQGDCATAARHQKDVDIWAINRLNRYHGFKIKTDIQVEDHDINDLFNTIDTINNPVMLYDAKTRVDMNITSTQYLGNIKYSLLDSLGMITLIEAGAGMGKTEMVKALARDGKRIMMIMPFTSTIKAKVEGDDGWDFAYGNKKVRFDTMKNVTLTVDKFSKLNLLEIRNAGFDYIFIDESHLLFQSEYRPVMPKVIDMIKNSEVPIIMMSGTPVGETVFFPELTHIKVIKDDKREKVFNINFVEDSEASFLYMCREMARDISENKRILFPTNKGTLYKEQIQAVVQYYLEEEFNCRYRDKFPVIVNYYKKSNTGESFMDSIDKKKTIGATDILLCSNYLSVGVDIIDRYNFSVYINDLWMPQEIEQFANRIRNNDLHIKMFVAMKDSEGNSNNVMTYKDIDLKLNQEELKTCHSIVRLCNASIERNPMEYKYNTLISSIIHNNKFVEYNDIENKYYLNETAYKVIMFERKYRDFVCQLPVITGGMREYGYRYTAQQMPAMEYKNGMTLEKILDVKRGANALKRTQNTIDIEELMEVITDDRLNIYKEVMSGKWEIIKGEDYIEDVSDRIMRVKNIEVFEKVVPLFTSLSKMYTLDNIREIFEHSRSDSTQYFNFSAINRIKLLSNIIYNQKRNRLDFPIVEYMQMVYEFVDRSGGKVKKSEITKFLDTYAENYAKSESNDEILIWKSETVVGEIRRSAENIFKCLVDISRPLYSGCVRISKVELLWKEKMSVMESGYKDPELTKFLLGDMLMDIMINDDATDNEEN